MFLKKLTMNGFKSFADNSEITFVKGISAIVGPNGCGKSNIVDAIIWVIGEQKTKLLRANNMVDVIFKGTEGRKGSSRAEVRLVLVNEQNILPIEFNEVEISRAIFADGENEYYINKKRVRHKDIMELFFDTGVGKSAYSIMAQGKIDMILSNKPEDRRYIIEEAAGITKYKVRRFEALSRLKQTNDNIIRINDIIDEVKAQFNSMKKQAEKAVKYRELHENEIKLEIEINLNRIIKNKKIEEELKEKLNIESRELEDIRASLDNLEGEVEEQVKNLTDFENQKIENQREIFKIQSDIKILHSKKDIFLDQINQYQISINNDSSRIEYIENTIKEMDEELNNIDNIKLELDDKIESLNYDREFYIENISNIEKEITTSQSLVEEYKIKINNLNDKLDTRKIEQKQTTEKLIVQIDKSLNIFDVNSEKISVFKNNLNENILYILENLPRKRSFIDDIKKAGYVSKDSESFIDMLGRLYDELDEIEKRVISVNENMTGYINTIEKFLNDIFGPDGLLQQKRKIEHDIDEFSDEIGSCTTEIENQTHEIIRKKDKKEELNRVLHELNINLTTHKEKRNSIDNDLKRLMSMKSQQENNREELVNKINFYRNKMNEINNELDNIKNKESELNIKKNSLEKELVDIDNKIREENNKISTQQKDIKDISSRWMNKNNQVEKIRIRIAEATTTITNIYDNFYENYSIDLVDFEKKEGYSSNREYDEIKNELNTVKSEKHALGSVNLMAIEESKNLEARYKLLVAQHEDLENAKKDIDKMMEKINKVSEELFQKTFTEIKENFQKIFKKLFEGGNGDITLTNPDNILETGIDIIAHPPGQKTQSITLLSGGQRTMTAISLMFATFLVKPSPFCLLDEIDAALDEENISRFIKLLGEMKEKSQFIIITHNKKTISAANVMYGVTMEEKGVSKIVSTKIFEKTN